LRKIVGDKLTKIYDIMIFLYLFTTTVVMIAGSGATGQSFNLSYWWGVAVIVIALIVLFFRDINGVLSINEYILSLLRCILLYLFLLFPFDQDLSLFSICDELRNWNASLSISALYV